MSLSSRRAWIEINPNGDPDAGNMRRSPHGERGLKFANHRHFNYNFIRRSPHGERGLKYHNNAHSPIEIRSLSSRRAWIEILDDIKAMAMNYVALLTESVD